MSILVNINLHCLMPGPENRTKELSLSFKVVFQNAWSLICYFLTAYVFFLFLPWLPLQCLALFCSVFPVTGWRMDALSLYHQGEMFRVMIFRNWERKQRLGIPYININCSLWFEPPEYYSSLLKYLTTKSPLTFKDLIHPKSYIRLLKR